MRRRFAAQLIDGTLQKDGYLYLSSFDGKDYAAIFVSGEMLGLQAVKDAGKLSDFLACTETAIYTHLGGATPSVATNDIWRAVRYAKPAEDWFRPSIQLKKLYDRIISTLGVSAAAIPNEAKGIRIIPAEIKGIQRTTLELDGVSRPMASDGTYPVCLISTDDLLGDIIQVTTAKVARSFNGGGTTYTGMVQQFYTRQPLKLTFPQDWDDNLFIGYFVDGYAPAEENLLAIFQFYGDRSFDEDGNVSGESLRGRSVEIALDGRFLVISKSDYMNVIESGGLTLGWAITGHTCTMVVEGGELVEGSYVRLQDNLPSMTATELLKCIAALSGRVLNYDQANGITFDDLQFHTWQTKGLLKITKYGQVTRTFGDYGQNNRVTFSDGSGVDYTIDNDNLEAEHELLTMPFVQGGGMDDAVYVDEFVEGSVLGTDAGGRSLARVYISKINGIQQLCDASTQFKIEARMSLYEYEQVVQKTRLWLDGIRYTWTERSWQKEKASFTLAKLP